VNSVAGLLKQFFRDLPDPLFTSEHYAGFIDAARKSFLALPSFPFSLFSSSYRCCREDGETDRVTSF